ncbi:MAG: large conductance mechanosensitive channel protein MscL [Clostridiales bacterium]|nr:large conductance mechanosensitive channel protein MscL [Clostridiales bacterium]
MGDTEEKVEKKQKKEKKLKKCKEVTYNEDRGYYENNGKIDNLNEVIDNVKKVKHKTSTFWADFKSFIAKGNIIDLAIALAITTAFNALISSIVNSFIMPIAGFLIGNHDLSDMKWVLREAVEADETLGTKALNEIAITYGQFLQALLNFLVIAFTLYFFVKIIMKLQKAVHKKELEEAEEKAKVEEEKKKAEEKAEEERREKIAQKKEEERKELLENVNRQTEVLEKIEELLKQKNQ